MFLKTLKEKEINSGKYIVADNNKKKQGEYINGLKIFSIDEINLKKIDYFIICTSNPLSIFSQLINLGINSESILISWNEILNLYIESNKLFFKFYKNKDENKILMLENGVYVKNSIIELKKCGKISVNLKNIPLILAFFEDDKLDNFFYYPHDSITLEKNKTFIDIGANIGTTSISCINRDYSEKVIAFEPDPLNYQQLQYNLGLNNINSKINSFPFGLSSKNTKGFLSRSNFCAGDTQVSIGYSSPSENEIQLYKLDDITFKQKIEPTHLWLDVQGHEFFVLLGSEN